MYRVKTFISGLSKSQTLGILLQRTCASVQTVSDRTQTTNSFLNGSSSVYTESMYEAWLQDPSSVHKVIQFYLTMASGIISYCEVIPLCVNRGTKQQSMQPGTCLVFLMLILAFVNFAIIEILFMINRFRQIFKKLIISLGYNLRILNLFCNLQ